MSSVSTRYARCRPSPPRCRPAPPEPGRRPLALDADGVFGLHHLGRRVHHVRHVDANHRRAVAVVPCALAAAVNLVEGGPGAVGTPSAEEHQARRGRPAGGDAFRPHRFEGLEDGVGDPLRGLVVAAHHRALGGRIEQRAGPGHDLERAVAAAARLDVGPEQGLDHVEDRGRGDEGRGVHRPPRRVVGPGEVEARAVALDRHPHADGDRPAAAGIVVEPVLALVGAVGDRREGGPHLRLGPVVDRGDGGEHRLPPMLGADVVHALLGRPARGDLRQDVALALVRAPHVGADHVELLAVGAGGGEEAERRNPQALLPGVGGARDIAAGHGAADVRPVGEARREGDDPAFGEDRADRLHVRQVVAADLGQVQEPDIAGLQPVVRHPLQELAHGEAHDPHVHGDVAALGNEVAVGIGERRREIARLAQQRRARRAHDHERHLLRRRRQRVADDLQGDRVHGAAHGPAPVAMWRWPASSAVSVAPGGTTTVDHASSTMTGPSSGQSAPRAARS